MADSKDEKRPLVGLSVIKSMQDYITRIISVPGMKALVLDQETVCTSSSSPPLPVL